MAFDSNKQNLMHSVAKIVPEGNIDPVIHEELLIS